MMDGSPSKFPVNSLKAQRLLVAAREISLDKMKAATRGIWNQFWGQDRNLEEDSVLRDALTSAGFSEAEITKLFADINTPAIKDKLNANTKLCLDKKGFGAPWLWATKTDEKGQVVEDFYFGNDRWETVALFLEENWWVLSVRGRDHPSFLVLTISVPSALGTDLFPGKSPFSRTGKLSDIWTLPCSASSKSSRLSASNRTYI